MNTQAHWQQVYRTRSSEETSWYEPNLLTSMDCVLRAPDNTASIIDVGGGSSTLVDDLLREGYRAITVLDVAHSAIEQSQARLGTAAESVQWLVGDVTTVTLPARAYDVWHDRAVFHFLVHPKQRAEYVGQIVSALKRNGQVIIATFGPEGPQTCSGLPTRRYDAESLQHEFGPDFHLLRSSIVEHRTPMETSQQCLDCHFSFAPRQEGYEG